MLWMWIPLKWQKTRKRLTDKGFGPDILTIKHLNFANIDQVAEEAGGFDFVLADLGVSSMQIDNPDRGFSFKNEGPLDLRLDPSKGETAAERLKKLNFEELKGMLVENSDEPYAEQIARKVMNEKKHGRPIETTTRLKEVIEEAHFFPAGSRAKKEAVKKSCQRTFQALRIDVNSEFEVLYQFLEKLPLVLKPGGKAAILTFHSGEDRLVKKSFQAFARERIYEAVAKEVIRPSPQECAKNPRAHSTKMRWAIRSHLPLP